MPAPMVLTAIYSPTTNHQGELAAHLQDPPKRLQVAALRLDDGAEDMAPDNLRRQTDQSGNRTLGGHDGAAAADGARRCDHVFVTEGKTTTTTT